MGGVRKGIGRGFNSNCQLFFSGFSPVKWVQGKCLGTRLLSCRSGVEVVKFLFLCRSCNLRYSGFLWVVATSSPTQIFHGQAKGRSHISTFPNRLRSGCEIQEYFCAV